MSASREKKSAHASGKDPKRVATEVKLLSHPHASQEDVLKELAVRGKDVEHKVIDAYALPRRWKR
jgi:hypothetical protein